MLILQELCILVWKVRFHFYKMWTQDTPPRSVLCRTDGAEVRLLLLHVMIANSACCIIPTRHNRRQSSYLFTVRGRWSMWVDCLSWCLGSLLQRFMEGQRLESPGACCFAYWILGGLEEPFVFKWCLSCGLLSCSMERLPFVQSNLGLQLWVPGWNGRCHLWDAYDHAVFIHCVFLAGALKPTAIQQKSYFFWRGMLKLLTGVSFKAVTFLPPHLELEESP